MSQEGPPVDPAAAAEHHARERVAFSLVSGLSRPWATIGLLLAVASAHLVLAGVMLSRGRGFFEAIAGPRGPNLLTRSGAMSALRLDQGELWRLVSAVFLHGDGLHLLVNMMALWSLGRLAESIYGPVRFLWLYLLCGIAGATLSWVGGNTLSVGASGAIFGLMGAAMVFGWRYRDALPEDIGRLFRRRILPWIVVNLIIGFLVPFIDNLGHTGGLCCGLVMAMVVGNRIVPGEESAWWVRGLMGAGSAVLIGAGIVGVSVGWGR